MSYNYVKTLDFGNVEIRRKYTDGKWIADIQLSDGDRADFRTDYLTGKLFAVLFDSEWNQK